MNLLAIDTSTEKATVAISIGDEMVCEEQPSLRQHAQVLLPMIERLLAATSTRLQQLDGIVFGRGPGSFTGLRIACSMGKALAYAQELPLYPVSCLSAIAWGARELERETPEAKILAVMDARMKEYYWGYFAENHDSTVELVTAPHDIVCENKKIVVAGVGFEVEQFSTELQQRICKQYIVYPEAQAMINIVRSGAVTPVTPDDALPVYIRNQVTQGESRG
jgi:tRNA threonylcarbamoyladenosine biosynthesis protein TsaB